MQLESIAGWQFFASRSALALLRNSNEVHIIPGWQQGSHCRMARRFLSIHVVGDIDADTNHALRIIANIAPRASIQQVEPSGLRKPRLFEGVKVQ